MIISEERFKKDKRESKIKIKEINGNQKINRKNEIEYTAENKCNKNIKANDEEINYENKLNKKNSNDEYNIEEEIKNSEEINDNVEGTNTEEDNCYEENDSEEKCNIKENYKMNMRHKFEGYNENVKKIKNLEKEGFNIYKIQEDSIIECKNNHKNQSKERENFDKIKSKSIKNSKILTKKRLIDMKLKMKEYYLKFNKFKIKKIRKITSFDEMSEDSSKELINKQNLKKVKSVTFKIGDLKNDAM